MDIQASTGGRLQHLSGKDPSVGHRHHDIGSQITHPGNNFWLVRRLWLQEGYFGSDPKQFLLDRWRLQLTVTPGGAVRLGEDAQELMLLRDTAEGRDPDIPGAGE